MDIEYLLFLQNIRNALNGVLNGFFEFVTNIAVGYYIFLIPLIIYWTVDKKKGLFTFCTLGIGLFINAFLKVTFCVYRPFVRDPRVKPLESILPGAGGYSFPSGHSTCSSSTYFAIAEKFKKYKGLVAFCLTMIALTLFSRNFFGVHTPQDVIAGCLSGFVALKIALTVEKYIDKNPDKDKYVVILVTVACIALLTYVVYKSYPMDYVDGVLLVDPAKLRIDSFRDPGFFYGAVWSWYLDRKLNIDTSGSNYQKFMRCIVGALLFVAYYTIVVSAIGSLINISAVYFLLCASAPILFTIVYPLTWKKKK